jgi:hypothetical protein
MRKLEIIVGATILFLSTIGLVNVRAHDEANDRQELNAGFFLLHDLLQNEEGLPFLLDVKTSPPDVQDFAKKISQTAKVDLVTLDHMRAGDPAIKWDKNPLPKFEQDVRASITTEKEHQLLFGTRGPDFARALLISQAEATKYAANIAKVLAEREHDPAQVRDLQRMSDQWHALSDQTFRLLRNY